LQQIEKVINGEDLDPKSGSNKTFLFLIFYNMTKKGNFLFSMRIVGTDSYLKLGLTQTHKIDL